MRKWAALNPELKKDIERRSGLKYRTTHPERHLCRGAKSRSKAQGVPFNLTPDDVIPPALCPVLGFPLKIARGRMNDYSPSVDRIDPQKGYVVGNVVVVSMRANRLKSDATLDELQKIARFYTNLVNRRKH